MPGSMQLFIVLCKSTASERVEHQRIEMQIHVCNMRRWVGHDHAYSITFVSIISMT